MSPTPAKLTSKGQITVPKAASAAAPLMRVSIAIAVGGEGPAASLVNAVALIAVLAVAVRLQVLPWRPVYVPTGPIYVAACAAALLVFRAVPADLGDSVVASLRGAR